MNDFEKRLKALRLREPSLDLDDRVISVKSPIPAPAHGWSRPVPAWAAAAVCMALCLAAFFLGAAQETLPAPDVASPANTPPPVRVYVIYDSDQNPFDFRNENPGVKPVRLEKGAHSSNGV